MSDKKAKPKYFITHSWRDNIFAQSLVDDLRKYGLVGFFDVYSVKPGDELPTQIAQGLEDCDIYVLILSKESANSPWCQYEIGLAITLRNTRGRDGRPKIIPILIEECEVPKQLRHFLHFRFIGRSYEDVRKELLKEVFEIEAEEIENLTQKKEVEELRVKLNDAENLLFSVELACPYCKAPLEVRDFPSEVVEYEGKDFDVDHEYSRYECGYEVFDGEVRQKCKRSDQKID